ncbi:MAG: DUF4175 family protein, partial [Sphingobacteriaceae bacterium]
MVDKAGKSVIINWQKKWKINNILSLILLAFAAAVFLSAIFHMFFSLSFWWILPVAFAFGVLFFSINSYWKITISDVARYLNNVFPELEESTELVFKPNQSLNLLEKLQKQKVEMLIAGLPQPKAIYSRLIRATIIFAVLFGFSILASVLIHFKHLGFTPIKEAFSPTQKSTIKPEVILPEIDRFNLKITPPNYTGKSSREQEKFAVFAEDGAMVSWEISTNKAVKQVSLLFNDHEKLVLKAANSDGTEWKAAKIITKSGFYQVDLGSKISELYQIEVIKDLPPVIRIQSPKPTTVIDFGEPQKNLLKTVLSDDYGIREAYINATIASGSGEAVKFKEQKIGFDASFSGRQTQYNLQKQLDLKALGMQPGDELYFYVKATDNHNQETRSEVYIVSIADTAKLMQMEGMANGLDVKP